MAKRAAASDDDDEPSLEQALKRAKTEAGVDHYALLDGGMRRQEIVRRLRAMDLARFAMSGRLKRDDASAMFADLCARDFCSPITGAPLALYSNALSFVNGTPGRTHTSLYLYLNQKCRITLTHLVRCVLSRMTPSVQLVDAAGNDIWRMPIQHPTHDPWRVPIPLNDPIKLYGTYLWGHTPGAGLVFLGGLSMISSTTISTNDEGRLRAELKTTHTAVSATDHVLVRFRRVAGFTVTPPTVHITVAGDGRLDAVFPPTTITITSTASGATAIQFVLSCEAARADGYDENQRIFVLKISSVRIDMDITLAVLATLPNAPSEPGYDLRHCRRDPLLDQRILVQNRTNDNDDRKSRIFNPMLHRWVMGPRGPMTVFIEQQLVAHSQLFPEGGRSYCTDTSATDFKDGTFQYITDQPRIQSPAYDQFKRDEKTPNPILFD